MSRFFTADQHFGHANILKHEAKSRRNARGSKLPSIEKMHEYLVDRWNATVKPGDVVYCLGDFSFKLQNICDVLPLLNGDKLLIAGNHDPVFKLLVEGNKSAARDLALQAGFSEVHLQLEIAVPGIGLVRLSHFPYAPPDQKGLPDFELRHLAHRPVCRKETLLLHGHVHSQWITKSYKDMPPMINVGVDVWEMRPVSESEIVEIFKELL